MNKPSERIVVFVTPAQKRAISATADELGISISELMRRAVIAFSATSDQVKAASIVDRLNAPRQPDALAQVLRRAAKPLRQGRTSPLLAAAAQPEETAQTDAAADSAISAPSIPSTAQENDETAPLHAANGNAAQQAAEPCEALPAAHAADPQIGSAAREIAQAVARLSAEADEASEAGEGETALSETANAEDDEPLQPLGGASSFTRATRPHGDADARHDGHDGGAPENGKFA